jgi:hypothetical protein
MTQNLCIRTMGVGKPSIVGQNPNQGMQKKADINTDSEAPPVRNLRWLANLDPL